MATRFRQTENSKSKKIRISITVMEIMKMCIRGRLKKGAVRPEQFEVSFSVLEDLESVNIALTGEEKLRLRGRIDRVDVRCV